MNNLCINIAIALVALVVFNQGFAFGRNIKDNDVAYKRKARSALPICKDDLTCVVERKKIESLFTLHCAFGLRLDMSRTVVPSQPTNFAAEIFKAQPCSEYFKHGLIYCPACTVPADGTRRMICKKINCGGFKAEDMVTRLKYPLSAIQNTLAKCNIIYPICTPPTTAAPTIFTHDQLKRIFILHCIVKIPIDDVKSFVPGLAKFTADQLQAAIDQQVSPLYIAAKSLIPRYENIISISGGMFGRASL